MAGCDVCIGGFDGDYCEFYDEKLRKARKPHQCSECQEIIPVGAKYQHCIGKTAGDFWAVDTCTFCAEVRRVFSCHEPEELGGTLWENMRDYAFPKLTTASPCFRELSAESKAKLLQKWNAWKFEGRG